MVHFTNTVTYFLPVPSTWFPLFKGGQGDFVHRPFIRHRSSEIEHLGASSDDGLHEVSESREFNQWERL